MSRVLALVEGQTEETFIRDMLAPALGLMAIDLRGFLAKKRGHGGVPKWAAFKPDLVRLLKGDATAHVTMMIDYYGMPADWPGRTAAKGLAYPKNVEHVEEEIAKDIATAMGEEFNPNRLIPYAQCHEYEALIFSDPRAVEAYVGKSGLASTLATIVSACGAPEKINDNQATAPSKRIVAAIPGYRKELYGTLLALAIGMPTMRTQCPHFNQWVSKLESLAPSI